MTGTLPALLSLALLPLTVKVTLAVVSLRVDELAVHSSEQATIAAMQKPRYTSSLFRSSAAPTRRLDSVIEVQSPAASAFILPPPIGLDGIVHEIKYCHGHDQVIEIVGRD